MLISGYLYQIFTFFHHTKMTQIDTLVFHFFYNSPINPSPAEPGYTLPLKKPTEIGLKSLQEYSADDINRQHFQMQVFLAF